MTWPRPAVVMLAVSGLTLIVTPLAVAGAGLVDAPPPVASVGDRHTTAASIAETSAPVAASVDLSGARAPGVSIQMVERASLAAYPPTSIQLPAIGVTASVVPVGIDANQAIEIPEDISTVGWYQLGVAPGSPVGSAVIVGHRDGRVDGHGAFYNLAAMSPGDSVTVRDTSGREIAYQVVAREVVAKSLLPTDDLFAIDGSPRLTLITCGGAYDASAGGYQANVIVTAVPISG